MWNPLKKSKPKEGKHYRFEDTDTEHTAIRILKGPYKDILYVYGTVSTDIMNDMCHLRFTFELIANHDESVDYASDIEFVTLLGDILTDVVVNNCKSEL